MTCNYDSALFRLAFAAAPLEISLALLQTITRWLIMQKARGHPPTQLLGSKDALLLPATENPFIRPCLLHRLSKLSGSIFSSSKPRRLSYAPLPAPGRTMQIGICVIQPGVSESEL